MPSVPFVCIFPFFLSFFFLPFIPFSLFFSLYSRRYRFLVSTVWSKKPRLISHRASLGEGTTTMSNRKLLISGQHFPLFSLSLSLYVCLCLSVSFSLSLSGRSFPRGTDQLQNSMQRNIETVRPPPDICSRLPVDLIGRAGRLENVDHSL